MDSKHFCPVESGDVYNVDNHPFLYMAVTANTEQVITVRADVISDYVSTIDPDREYNGKNVYFLHNPGEVQAARFCESGL